MTSGVMCQVRFARLLKPDSVLLRFAASRLKLEGIGLVTWHPPGMTPVPKQKKLPRTLLFDVVSKRKWRVPAVSVKTFGIRSKSAEAKKAVCLVVRTVS